MTAAPATQFGADYDEVSDLLSAALLAGLADLEAVGNLVATAFRFSPGGEEVFSDLEVGWLAGRASSTPRKGALSGTAHCTTPHVLSLRSLTAPRTLIITPY